jgi:hypothetical protein
MLHFKETLDGTKTLLVLFLADHCVLSLLLSYFLSPTPTLLPPRTEAGLQAGTGQSFLF